MSNPVLLFIGCGNMGASIISGALSHRDRPRIIGLDPDLIRARSLLPAGAEVELISDPKSLGSIQPDLVVLGVKPQIFGELDPRLMALLATAPTVSIMAGIPLKRLIDTIGHERVIRVMPNLPALVGAGMSLGCVQFGTISPGVLTLVEGLFAALGRFEWAANETEFELANPVFSCGPGFVFAFAEQMLKAAIASGVPENLADVLVRQTFLGSARMLAEDLRSPEEMKRAVTSPNGTTQAGLTALEAGDALPKVIPETLARAHRRALELAAQG